MNRTFGAQEDPVTERRVTPLGQNEIEVTIAVEIADADIGRILRGLFQVEGRREVSKRHRTLCRNYDDGSSREKSTDES